MTLEEQMKLALDALCKEHGSVEAVADAANLSADNLKQILAGTKLPSGRPRGIGPQTRDKLDRAFPGWSNPVVARGATGQAASREETGGADWSRETSQASVTIKLSLRTLSLAERLEALSEPRRARASALIDLVLRTSEAEE